MNRRGFIGTLLAVAAAPVAAAKGLFQSKAEVRLFPFQLDVLKELREAAERNPVRCELCGCEGASLYVRDLSKVGRSKYVNGVIDDPMPPLFLCNPCAEKQGYLCRCRDVEPCAFTALHGCHCGKRGCPSLRSPTDPSGIVSIVEKKRKAAVRELCEQWEDYLYGDDWTAREVRRQSEWWLGSRP